MTGAHVPYHLRSNKAVERSVFLDFLTRFATIAPIHTYGYIGFGALHLEEFKLLHSMFSITDMTSIEADNLTYRRQQFSQPISCIKLVNDTSGNFLDNWEREHNVIVWLDYTDPKHIGDQIREFQQLIGKLERYDIVKVTVNANPKSLGGEISAGASYETAVDRNQRRLKRLRARINNLLPNETKPDMVTKQNLPKLLGAILEQAGRHMMSYKPKHMLQPICAFTYSDSDHQMLSCTGIILPENEVEEILDKTGLLNWEFRCGSWSEPQRIQVPDLTVKERMALDSLLPNDDLTWILENFGLELSAADDGEFRDKIDSYTKYYKHYPHFSRVLF